MSVYVAGVTAYCAWAYLNERLVITTAPMGPEIVTLIEHLDANDAVYLEEGALRLRRLTSPHRSAPISQTA